MWQTFIHTFINIGNGIYNHREMIVLFVMGSGFLAPLSAAVKKFVTKHFHKPTELQMFFLVYTGGILLSVANYLVHVPTHNPGITAVQGAVLTVGSQPFYFKWIKPWLLRLEAQAATQQKLALDAQSAIIPPGGFPETKKLDTFDLSQ